MIATNGFSFTISITNEWPHADVQNLLVGVGALKPKDHRIVSSAQTDREDPYRSIRSGNTNAAKAEDDDDWD